MTLTCMIDGVIGKEDRKKGKGREGGMDTRKSLIKIKLGGEM